MRILVPFKIDNFLLLFLALVEQSKLSCVGSFAFLSWFDLMSSSVKMMEEATSSKYKSTCSRCTKNRGECSFFLNPFQDNRQQQTMYRRFISSAEKFHFHFSSSCFFLLSFWCRRSMKYIKCMRTGQIVSRLLRLKLIVDHGDWTLFNISSFLHSNTWNYVSLYSLMRCQAHNVQKN